MTFNELLDRPIAYQRCFVSLGAGIAGALLMSQAVYWSNRTKNKDHWFYKTQEEWKDETGMTRYEQETARKKLVKLGVIEEKKQGIPCRLFFRVNFQKLKEVLQSSLLESHKQECGIPTDSDVENQQPNTEITTETTTKITTKITTESSAESKNNFVMPDEWIEIAKEINPQLSTADILLAKDKFIDYWHAELQIKKFQRDWLAAWRNWIRNERVKPNNINQYTFKEPAIDFQSTDWIHRVKDIL